MAESSDRKALEKRLEQARRVADLALDPLTKERLNALVHELEEQLRLSEPGMGGGPAGRAYK
jgi:TATA-binding protein-associated factor Taf7